MNKKMASYIGKRNYLSRIRTTASIRIFIFLSVINVIMLLQVNATEGVEIRTVNVEIKEDSLIVNSDLHLDEGQIEDLQNGIEKEITFYVDLFRQWAVWPDEFISGTRIQRKIKSDHVKNEFSINSNSNNSDDEQRFSSLASLLSEALSLKGIELSSINHLRPGRYFVKVSAESRIRKLAPIVGYLLFFVPQMEFKVEKNSEVFEIPMQ
jgi:hypothetical protein